MKQLLIALWQRVGLGGAGSRCGRCQSFYSIWNNRAIIAVASSIFRCGLDLLLSLGAATSHSDHQIETPLPLFMRDFESYSLLTKPLLKKNIGWVKGP